MNYFFLFNINFAISFTCLYYIFILVAFNLVVLCKHAMLLDIITPNLRFQRRKRKKWINRFCVFSLCECIKSVKCTKIKYQLCAFFYDKLKLMNSDKTDIRLKTSDANPSENNTLTHIFSALYFSWF